MTPSEIAETLINGNISDAREAILTYGHQYRNYTLADIDITVMTLDVLGELCDQTGWSLPESGHQWDRLRRCLTGGT